VIGKKINTGWMIPGFRHGTNEIITLLGRYAALFGQLPTFRDYMSVPFWVEPVTN